MPNLDQLLMNNTMSSIMKCSLEIISCFSSQVNHQNYFIEVSFEIFLQIIMPVLTINQEDLDKLVNEPEEFVNFSNDLCSKRESSNVKCLAAQLLIDLSNNVDGMQTFIFDTCILILDNLIEQSTAQSQEYYQQIVQRFEIKFKDNQAVIEVILVIICILSEALDSRIDLRTSMGRVFMNLAPIILKLDSKQLNP